MKRALALFAFFALPLAVVGCTHENDVLDRPPGKYERTSSSTNAAGTSTERKETVDVGYDAQTGQKRAVVKQQTTRDPEGLFNKSTNETNTVIER